MEFLDQIVNAFTFIADFFFLVIDFIVHVDLHLATMMAKFGAWLYLILFLIVFCETGLVVTPFLPGDSLLFAAGALAAFDNSPLHVAVLVPLIITAALCGDLTNYSIGIRLGPAVFRRPDSFLLNQKHLHRAQEFYDKHGGRTIVIARFIPIIRTFVPFVAGIGKMKFRQYITYSIGGAVLWVTSFTVAGYVFGNLPVIKRNFHIVVLMIIFLSILPIVKEYFKAMKAKKLASNLTSKSVMTALCLLLGLANSRPLFAAGELAKIKKRGNLICGVSQGLPGFSTPNDKGQWSGLDSDFCRALAVAIWNDPNKVTFRPLSAKERFTALQTGEIDLLSRNTTWTISRENSLGLDFIGVMYYDGQGFIMRKSSKIKSAKELNGATVCVNTGTTTELNVADYFRANKLKYKILAFEKTDEVLAAYDAGRCDVYTTDQSGLYAERTKLKKPDDHVILPEIISKEPLGPAVRQGDDQWADVARSVLHALTEAEELGISSKNVADLKKSSDNPAIRRFLGVEGELSKGLEIPNDWTANVIAAVGNYGEIFDRHLGDGSTLKIKRAQNALWKDGGLHYPIPFR